MCTHISFSHYSVDVRPQHHPNAHVLNNLCNGEHHLQHQREKQSQLFEKYLKNEQSVLNNCEEPE